MNRLLVGNVLVLIFLAAPLGAQTAAQEGAAAASQRPDASAIAALKAQVEALKAEYEKRIKQLETQVEEMQAQLLRAEGFSAALERIFAIAQTVDQKTMTLQYFETLKMIGTSPSTKYIFPMEFTSMLEKFTKGDSK